MMAHVRCAADAGYRRRMHVHWAAWTTRWRWGSRRGSNIRCAGALVTPRWRHASATSSSEEWWSAHAVRTWEGRIFLTSCPGLWEALRTRSSRLRMERRSEAARAMHSAPVKSARVMGAADSAGDGCVWTRGEGLGQHPPRCDYASRTAGGTSGAPMFALEVRSPPGRAKRFTLWW
jgi:hypothetical protein